MNSFLGLFGPDFDAMADEWARLNPHAWDRFLALCQERADAREIFGFKAIAEVVRFECRGLRTQEGETFALNNNIVAYLGRRALRERPAIAPFVRTRKARWSLVRDAHERLAS